MKIKENKRISNKIPERFFLWLETDLECPECKKVGLVIKYRGNGKIGFFHESSGIILACQNWKDKCESKWNRIGNGREYPWHTWLSSFHKDLDIQRGLHGENFLNQLKKENLKLYNEIIKIDKQITDNSLINP